MDHANKPVAAEEDVMPRMGSEYADAATYLARLSSAPGTAVRKRPRSEPQPGSNDSDFGVPDQRAE